ncbi:hypothetical protein BOX15_Mlig019813g1, partial [Macrostomum lignano]
KLLREEFLTLHQKHNKLKQQYDALLAENTLSSGTSSSSSTGNTFVSNLLSVVGKMCFKSKYSDIVFQLADDSSIPGHRFVLQARQSQWGAPDGLDSAVDIDLSDLPVDVSHTLVSWAYTDLADLTGRDEEFCLSLLGAASKFGLPGLVEACERALVPVACVANCIRLYMLADELKAAALKAHCSAIISEHWSDFAPEDFSAMPAPLLLDMLESKLDFPLHAAVKSKRDDVVFLYLSRHFNQDRSSVNQLDSKGEHPLGLALNLKLEGIAENLLAHNANLNSRDPDGFSLLHRAIRDEDEFAAAFLITRGCDVNCEAPANRRSPLHQCAAAVSDCLFSIAEQLVIKGARVNAQDADGVSPLHLAVSAGNSSVFGLLLSHPDLDANLADAAGSVPLWLTLRRVDGGPGDAEARRMCAELVRKGASPDATGTRFHGDSLLHRCARDRMEQAAIYLCQLGAKPNTRNERGETPLHTAAHLGLAGLAKALLAAGADPNTQMTGCLQPSGESDVTMQTAIHLAICGGHRQLVQTLLVSDLSVRDSQGNSAFSLALWNGMVDVADQLLRAGACINEANAEGLSLLQQAVLLHSARAALFLIEHGADIHYVNPSGESSLQLAIKAQLPAVVKVLCQRGANLETGCPLSLALEAGQEEMAAILIEHGASVTPWLPGPEAGQERTLLQQLLDGGQERSAVFLIRRGAEVNVITRGCEDKQTPLHVCAQWGLEGATHALIERNADVNAQDADGNTPLHLAIQGGHMTVVSLLLSHPGLDLRLRNARGATPFASAMESRIQRVAQAIVDREPTAPELRDNQGRNFLHKAVLKADLDSVLFLISISADVNSRVRDQTELAPLHLCVAAPSTDATSSVARHLLLAGADPNARTSGQRRTPLHLACAAGNCDLAGILLENESVEVNCTDDGGETPLHLAMREGHLPVCRLLLQQHRRPRPQLLSAANIRGQTPLHLLAQYGRENAASIFDCVMAAEPQTSVDLPDAEGNTALLLAYMQGNVRLCTALVRAGASLGAINKYGKTVFNHQVPTTSKQLLHTLLDILDKEPGWVDGDFCLECGTRFSLKTRKHHCRHCGRLLCASCSKQQCAIVKYGMRKPERVCQFCFDYITCRYGVSD